MITRGEEIVGIDEFDIKLQCKMIESNDYKKKRNPNQIICVFFSVEEMKTFKSKSYSLLVNPRKKTQTIEHH